MKKIYALLFSMLFVAGAANAQSKVFKEVSDEIATSMQPIVQDGALVGYLVFTQLEKASEDSFNYKLTIMDENLNDLGTVNFREERIMLEAVAFEQDVLCVAYFKSSVLGKEFKNRKAYNQAADDKNDAVMLQFLNLDGKIIKTTSLPASINTTGYNSSGFKVVASGKLKHDVQLKNIPQKGFACFYADDSDNPLILFNTAGERIWKKKLADEKYYVLLTTADDIYMLTRTAPVKSESGDFVVTSYGVADSAEHISRYKLRDKEGKPLTVFAFANDPVTGKPFVAGSIINEKYKNYSFAGKGYSKGAYSGLYTINFTGKTESDIKSSFSYWSDGSKMPDISKKGKYADNGMYIVYDRCIRDFNGNTYFVGSTLLRKVRIGAIVTSVVLTPVLIGPIWLASAGTHKYKIRDAAIVKLDAKGNLNFENSIDCNSSNFFHGKVAISMYDTKKFFEVSNSATKANYVVVDDTKDIVIYNINQKKIARTISHKDGKSRINIYPAKEGHIMVSEYNKKEKYTRLSIEAL